MILSLANRPFLFRIDILDVDTKIQSIKLICIWSRFSHLDLRGKVSTFTQYEGKDHLSLSSIFLTFVFLQSLTLNRVIKEGFEQFLHVRYLVFTYNDVVTKLK